MSITTKYLRSRALIAAGGAAVAGSAALANPADFYSGRQVNFIVSAGEGGGYSSYANAFAPYLSRHLPGSPKIVVQNMPGAGGIRATNFLYSIAPKDGSTIGMVHSTVPYAPLYGLKGVSFKPQEFNWVGAMNRTTAICAVWHASGIRTWEDVVAKGFVVGGTGPTSQMETLPSMINKLFGTKIKIVSGYRGGNEIYLAMERGEVDGRCASLISSLRSTRPEWLTQNKVYIPLQIAMERSPTFPNATALGELIKDETTKQIFKFVLAPLEAVYPILAPPNVPADRIAALRAAFTNAINDADFQKAASNMGLEIEKVSGERIAQIVDDIYAMQPEIIKAGIEAAGAAGD